MSQPDPITLCIERFVQMEGEFIAALLDVFPECMKLKTANVKFNIACKLPGQHQQRIEEWIQYMFPLKRAIQDRDHAKVMVNKQFPPSVQEIDIQSKWQDPDVDDETRAAIYDYLDELMRIADMYHLYTAVPGGMMTSLTSMAEEIAADMREGRMDMTNLDFQGLSARISAQIDPEDLNAFAQGIDPGLMQNMLGNMMQPPR